MSDWNRDPPLVIDLRNEIPNLSVLGPMKKTFSTDLTDTVAHADKLELPADIAEFAIDQILDNEVLKDIPFVGWIAKGASIYTSISDRIFFNKILRFLTQLHALGAAEKASFSAKIFEDPAYRSKVGERLILALDRLDEPTKSEYLAKCFDSFLLGLLSYEEFSELAHIVDRSFINDLIIIESEKSSDWSFEWDRMMSSGLANIELKEFDDYEKPDKPPELRFSLSTSGELLRHVLRGTLAEAKAKEAEERRVREESLKQFRDEPQKFVNKFYSLRSRYPTPKSTFDYD